MWTIDSQWDFTDRLWVTGPLGPGVRPDPRSGTVASLFLPHAWSNLLQTGPAYMGPFEARPWIFPSRSHAAGEGDIQPLRARDPRWAQGAVTTTPGCLRQEEWHVNGQLDGVPLQGLTVLASEVGTRQFTREDGTPQDALGPGSFRAWVRVDRAAGRRGAGLRVRRRGDALDRLPLYFDARRRWSSPPTTRPWTSARRRRWACRRAAPRCASICRGRSRRATGYHIAAHWKGAREPSDLALSVDGRAGGRVSLAAA
ncbi:MAG: hypothetical protein KIT58_02175 [Planctomycetota bacterium]|nr:hypothetical protein [Planctomycetota bacterium]